MNNSPADRPTHLTEFDEVIAARREEFCDTEDVSDLGHGLGRSSPHDDRHWRMRTSVWESSPTHHQPTWGHSPDASWMKPVASDQTVDRNQWKGRRRMAWVALVAVLVVTSLSIFHIPTERLEVLSDIIMWFFVTMGSIIGAYMGFTAWWARSGSTNKHTLR